MTTTTGSCACREIEYQFTGEVAAAVLCHCGFCQKWTGSAFTSNAVVPRAAFTITKGTPKVWSSIGDSDKTNRHFFCGTCGSSLYTEPETMPTLMTIKAGGLDNGAASLGNNIKAELYTTNRVDYLQGCEGAKQELKFPRE